MGAGPVRALDGHGPDGGALRSLAAPRPIEVVTTPAGVPHAVLAGGRRRLVVAVRDEWLVQDRWWTDEPVDRHYFELMVEPGRPMVAFHEAGVGWFAHA